MSETLSITAPVDQLAPVAREGLTKLDLQAQSLERVLATWIAVEERRQEIPKLTAAGEEARERLISAEGELNAAVASLPPAGASSSALAKKARDLVALVDLGRRVGLHDTHCPLCAADRSETAFQGGLSAASALAAAMDEEAAAAAEAEQNVRKLAEVVAGLTLEAEQAASRLVEVEKLSQDFDQRRADNGLGAATREEARAQLADIKRKIDVATGDLRVLATLRLDTELNRSQRGEAHVRERLAIAQDRAALARGAEQAAQLLYDSARRAASETLDRRLEQVLPLMSELYRRLRPHPMWRDIEYSIRGDVRKFLKLQVGGELNPQFIFSSGQRRATGLAFLLSVNLSLAWSRLRTIMLDDPVQHVDDFRTVHLAEVASHLVKSGRQIICSVEDTALADLLCRRLPVSEYGAGKRISLAPNVNGDLSVVRDDLLAPLPYAALASGQNVAAAG